MIKSERAKAYISEKDELMQYSGLITTEYAEQAIGLAESDAEARCRERAVRAFRTMCPFNVKGECRCVSQPHAYRSSCFNMMPEECTGKFIRLYDNE